MDFLDIYREVTDRIGTQKVNFTKYMGPLNVGMEFKRGNHKGRHTGCYMLK